MLGWLATKFLSKENLRVFALWALRLVEEQLDTDLKPRLEKYRQDRASLEEQTKTLLAEILERETRLAAVRTERLAILLEIQSNEEVISKLQQEVTSIDEEPSKVDNDSDSDVLRGDMRRRV